MILYRYILKAHFLPFVFSLVTLICIFLLQFLMRFADRLVGKGLDSWVIVKLIVYNLSWMVVLVVPMASLVATLMAFGSLSQNNEITIMKSSGVSLYKMMIAPLLASLVVAVLLFQFNNDVLPDANHQAKILMSDISRTKPTLSLEPGFFSQEVDNYAILVRSINQTTNWLYHITIYDHSNGAKINVVTADSGKIFFSKDLSKLIMDLYHGEIHESDVQNTTLYRILEFEKHMITMNGDQFSLQQSGPASRGERELSVQDMQYITDSLKVILASNYNSYLIDSRKLFFMDTSKSVINNIESTIGRNKDLTLYRSIEKVRTNKNILLSSFSRMEWTQREIEKYEVEIYKKYALPAACIIFVLIGAPLGVMVRKGGFGVAAGISLFFFLIYWAFLIGGEKLSERGFFSPFIGMWAANILLGVSGIILIIVTNKETKTLTFTFLKSLIPKRFRQKDIYNVDENTR
ncbi:MAG TPA: LptF/LptG family permease [Ignavibacteriaceae bacterium]|nr:LptF/LptG family permease [Ignavibacteriaceae bacterium]